MTTSPGEGGVVPEATKAPWASQAGTPDETASPSVSVPCEPAERPRPRRFAMGVACLLLAGAVSVGVGAAIGHNAAVSQTGGQASSIETPDGDRADATPSTDQGGSVVDESQADDVSSASSDEVADASGDVAGTADDTATLPSSGDATSGQATTAAASDGTDGDQGEKAASCDHAWEPYGVTTKVTKARTHQEKVPAETTTETEYHTVCNECHETIDGHAAEHLEETGHSGYTTNVPKKVTKVTRKASTKTVVDTPAMKVSTWHQKRCTKCGEVKDLKSTKTKVEPAKGSK